MRITTILLVILWLIVTIIFSNLYKCRLTSLLISPKLQEFNNIDELVDLNYDFYSDSLDSSVILEKLTTSNDTKFLSIFKNLQKDSLCTSILTAYKEKAAVLNERLNILYGIYLKCSNLESVKKENLRIVKRHIGPSYHSWPIQPNAPYLPAINAFISQLHASGLIDYWHKGNSIPRKILKKKLNYSSLKNDKITRVSLIGPGIVWVIGNIAAILCFAAERIKGGNKIII